MDVKSLHKQAKAHYIKAMSPKAPTFGDKLFYFIYQSIVAQRS